MIIFELPCVILIISICFYFFQRKKKELKEYLPLIKKFKDHFCFEIQFAPSIHQIVSMYTGNTIIKSLYCIVSLSKDFCASQLLFTPQPSKIVVTGHLKNLIRPNFYIYKSKFKLKHAGLEYSKKYLLSTAKNYQVYGVVNDAILNFIAKYDLDIFYCSYVPKEASADPVFQSTFYLRGSTDLLQPNGFTHDLVKILEENISDTEKRINDIKRKHLLKVEKFKEEENMGFLQKIKKEVQSKNNPPITKKNKRN